MKCKNIVYKSTETPTIEKAKEYKDAGYFFRFQDAYIRLTEKSKSWPMCYSTATEARKAGELVSNGKSCVENFYDLIDYTDVFAEEANSVVLIFEGSDTGESGDDMNEVIATFYEAKAVWNYKDFIEFIPEIERETEKNVLESFGYMPSKSKWLRDSYIKL